MVFSAAKKRILPPPRRGGSTAQDEINRRLRTGDLRPPLKLRCAGQTNRLGLTILHAGTIERVQ